jgi:integrase
MELTIQQYKATVQKYLHVCAQKRLDKNTIIRKTELLTRLQTFLGDKSFSPDTANEFLQSLTEVGDSTREFYGRIIRGFVSYCYEEELFRRNWSRKIILPKLHRTVIEVVSESTAWEIILAGTTPGKYENTPSRKSKIETRLALQFMLLSGCRVDEVEKMKGLELRLNADEPYVIIHSKGGDIERQPVPQSMIKVLHERQSNSRLFNFRKKTANKLLHRGSKSLGITEIETTCHRLRDIFAVSRLRKGEPLQLVSRALRHKSIKTTDRYYSNYILSDIAPVVNNSDIVKQELTPMQLHDELLKQIKKAGLHLHSEFELKTQLTSKGLHVFAKFK